MILHLRLRLLLPCSPYLTLPHEWTLTQRLTNLTLFFKTATIRYGTATIPHTTAMGKRKKGSAQWIKETLALQDDHRWSCKPGYKVFVADRGAVRFDVPSSWHIEPDTQSFKFMDKKPPNDDCRLEVSFNRLPAADYSLFPLEAILRKVALEDSRDVIEVGEVVRVKRQTARIVWLELKFMDCIEQREAYSRICLGLGSQIQCLITFDFWAADRDRMTPVWDEVLQTLTLGLYIRDPSTGLAYPD